MKYMFFYKKHAKSQISENLRSRERKRKLPLLINASTLS